MSPHSPLCNYPVIAAHSGVAVEDLNTNKKSLRFCTIGLPSDVIVEVGDMSFHLHKGRRAGSLGAIQNWSRAVSCRSRAVPESCRAVPESCRAVPEPCRSRADEVAVLGPEAKLPLLSRFRYLRQRRNGLSSSYNRKSKPILGLWKLE